MNKAFEKILERLEETDFSDIQMTVREVLLKYGFPYESVVQDEVWDALDELSTNKFAKRIVQEVAEEYKGGWISCKDRLPEEWEYYLVCDGQSVFIAEYADYEWRYHRDEHTKDYVNVNVIAWQPLPDPYNEQD